MEKSDKLPFTTKLCFGFGEIPGTTSKTAMGILWMFFLTDIVGIAPAMAGAIFMIGRLWDGFADPLMGMISDRTRSRWGRRRPYFILAAVPLGVTYLLLWHSYPSFGHTDRFVIYTLVYIAYMTAMTVYFVPYLGLMAELTDDYAERTSINNYRMFFSFLFGLMAAVVPKVIVDTYGDKRMGFIAAGALVAILVTAVPFVVFATTRERFQGKAERKEGFNILKELLTIFKNRAFMSLVLIYVGSYAAINVIEGFVIYYMKYWIGREEEMPVLFVCVVIASAISLPIWSLLTKKIGKKNAVTLGLLFWCLSQFTWLFLTPSSPSLVVFLTGAIVGIGYGGAHTLPWAIFPDVMDQDELETGERREGVYSGIMTFLMKMANSLALFMVGLVLQIVGYVPNISQKGTALQAIRYLMCFGPLVFVLLGLVGVFLFPITVERYEQIRRELDARRENA